jgi:hypothetical protein
VGRRRKKGEINMDQQQPFIRYYPKDRDEFAKGGDAWLSLNAGYDVTMTERAPFITDIWDSKTGKLYDLLGNEIGWRDRPFEAYDTSGNLIAGRTTYLPGAIDPSIPDEIKDLLDKGYEVSVNESFEIIDVWNATTKQVMDKFRKITGTRDYSFLVQIAGFITVTIDNFDKFDLPSEVIEKIEAFFAEHEGGQVTVNGEKIIVDMWDLNTYEYFDHAGTKIGKRLDPYNARSARKFGGSIITYSPKDRFNEDLTTEVKDLLAEGYHVTISGTGEIIDIWDPTNWRTVDTNRNTISARVYPYPSENNLSAIELDIKLLYKTIDDLEYKIRDVKYSRIPLDYFFFGYGDGEPGTALPPYLLYVQENIMNELGDYDGLMDNNLEVIFLVDHSENHEWSITGYDVTTLKDLGVTSRTQETAVDPVVVNKSIMDLKGIISGTRANLVQKNNWLGSMKRHQGRVNPKVLAKRINKS